MVYVGLNQNKLLTTKCCQLEKYISPESSFTSKLCFGPAKQIRVSLVDLRRLQIDQSIQKNDFSPRARIVTLSEYPLEQRDLLYLQLRLEALHQIVVLISGMEEKGGQQGNVDRSSSAFQSSSLLTSVRLQFLAGCFGLGTVGAGGLRRESVQLHHYQV